MRVCIISEFFYPDNTGGTGSALTQMARSLKDNYEDVELDIITSRHLYREKGEALPSQEDWDGIHIFRLHTPFPRNKRFIMRLAANVAFSTSAFAKLLLRKRYDVVLVTTAPPPAPMAAQLYKALTHIPFVYLIYDLEPDRALSLHILSRKSWIGHAVRKIQKRWMFGADRLVVIGRCMKDYLCNHYALPQQNIDVAPVGFDPMTVVPTPFSKFKNQHGIKGFVALYSGNFGRYHNIDVILDAAKEFKSSKTDVTFVMVGDGAQKNHIEERIKLENLTNVKLFPYVPQIEYSDLLAAADVCLVTLEQGMEGICVPSKFYSILSAGKPTIAMLSKMSEVAMVIHEGKCGLQVNPGNVKELVTSIHYLKDNPELTEKMGSNARHELVTKYTTDHTVSHIHQILLECTLLHPIHRHAIVADRGTIEDKGALSSRGPDRK